MGGSFGGGADAAFAYIADNGRGGLGTNIVKAAGNDNQDSNGDGLNATRYTISVSATTQNGFIASYSNFGADILIAAPAAAVTTDITGAGGYSPATTPPLSTAPRLQRRLSRAWWR